LTQVRIFDPINKKFETVTVDDRYNCHTHTHTHTHTHVNMNTKPSPWMTCKKCKKVKK
jgi:hypothetical protein